MAQARLDVGISRRSERVDTLGEHGLVVREVGEYVGVLGVRDETHACALAHDDVDEGLGGILHLSEAVAFHAARDVEGEDDVTGGCLGRLCSRFIGGFGRDRHAAL